MGGIVAILGEGGDPSLEARASAMLVRSPYRGAPELLVDGPLAIGVQSMGWDASLAVTARSIVAFHGYGGSPVEELGAEGEAAPGASRAERIALAWERLGERVVERLRGEWALVVWDRRERVLFAARDLVGCRPLFWGLDGKRLIVGSEVRQVAAGIGRAPRVRPEVAALLLVDSTAMGRNTAREGVERLPPGRLHRWRHDGPRGWQELERWTPPPEPPAYVPAAEQGRHLGSLRSSLVTAVRDAVAPVPLAVGLSGGVDSSVLWAILAAEKPAGERPLGVTMTYEGMSCDETELVRATHAALGTGGRFADAARESLLAHVEDLAARLDEPFFAILASLKFALGVALEEGRRVYLTGMGPDELFAWSPEVPADLLRQGHPWRALRDIWNITDSPRWRLRLARRTVRSLLPARSPGPGGGRKPPPWVGKDLWPAVEELLEAAAGEEGASGSRRRRYLAANLRRYQGGVHVGSMEQLAASFGIEVRSPFLARGVMEAGFALPACLTSGEWGSKHALRALFEGVLPREVLVAPKLLFDELEAREFPAALDRLRDDAGMLESGIVDRRWLEGLGDGAVADSGGVPEGDRQRNLVVRLAGLSAWLEAHREA